MAKAPLSICVGINIPCPVHDSFNIFKRLDPADFLHHDALIARVTAIKQLTDGEWDHAGAVQEIHFADGSRIQETLLSITEGRSIAYQGKGFSQPIVSWADYAQAQFEFLADGEGTRLNWHYDFFLKDSPLGVVQSRIFETLFLNVIYKRFMTKTLSNLRKIITLRHTVATNQRAQQS